MTHFNDFLFHFDEFLKGFLKDFLEEFHRGTTASEIPEEASSVESLALLNAPRTGGGFGRSPLDNNDIDIRIVSISVSITKH